MNDTIDGAVPFEFRHSAVRPGDGHRGLSGSAKMRKKQNRYKPEVPAVDRDLLDTAVSIASGRGRPRLEEWPDSPGTYTELCERLIQIDERLLACDILAQLTKKWADHKRLRQLHALALARSGATMLAQELLEELATKPDSDGETLGILARTYKDLWHQTKELEHLKQSHGYYWMAFESTRGKADLLDGALYNGINAATTAFLLGVTATVEHVVPEVEALCEERLRRSQDYWATATLAEAALLRQDVDAAAVLFADAVKLEPDRFADHASTLGQAQSILDALGEDRHRIDAVFRLPTVVVFAGHMIDKRGRPAPRFPPALENAVRDQLKKEIARLGPVICFSGAACGADILFLEEIQNRKGESESNVVLPYPKEEFRKVSVDIVDGGNWGSRFEAVLKKSRVVVASEHRTRGSPTAYEYASQIQNGLALLKARALHAHLVPLAVWDGRKPADGPGGTHAFLEYWQENSAELRLIKLDELSRDCIEIKSERDPGALTEPSQPEPPADLSQQAIRALFFADVKEFSSIDDDLVPVYVREFMNPVAKLASRYGYRRVETWGDAFYFVFDSIHSAGVFALKLRDWVHDQNWRVMGLPEDLYLRIALHAGPVHACPDPFNKVKTGESANTLYMGWHVTRTARTEPVTPPGAVFASEAFAALAAAQGATEFVCEYVGQVPLPKAFGTYRTYGLRWAAGTKDEPRRSSPASSSERCRSVTFARKRTSWLR